MVEVIHNTLFPSFSFYSGKIYQFSPASSSALKKLSTDTLLCYKTGYNSSVISIKQIFCWRTQRIPRFVWATRPCLRPWGSDPKGARGRKAQRRRLWTPWLLKTPCEKRTKAWLSHWITQKHTELLKSFSVFQWLSVATLYNFLYNKK